MATKRKTRRKGLLSQVPLVTNPFDAAKRKKSALLHVGKSSSKAAESEKSEHRETAQNISMPPTPQFSIPSSSLKRKPPIARNSTLCTTLPFEGETLENCMSFDNAHSNHSTSIGVEFHNDSNHTQHEFIHMDDNNSQSWLQSKYIEPASQSNHYSHHAPPPHHLAHHNNNNSNSNSNMSNSHNKPPLLATNSNMYTQSAYLTPMEHDRGPPSLSQIDVMNNRIFNHTKSKINTGGDARNNKTLHEQQGDDSSYDDNMNNDDNKTEYIASKDLKVPLLNEYLDDNERIDVNVYRKQQKGIVLNDRYHRCYEELEMLGNGSFGKVYKCRNRDDGCFYAVKKIKIQSIHRSKSVKEKCMKEGVVLSALQRAGAQCVNIIQYNSMWIEHDYFYLVTEYCDNGNLYNLYNLFSSRDEINEQVFMKILSDICNALSFLHDQGFVHFDVKPENILLSKHADCKLADFGLCTKAMHSATDIGGEAQENRSRHQNSSNGSNTNIALSVQEGDARYLCRELIEATFDVADLDKVDIFALGCTMYEIIICEDLPSNGFKWQQIRNGDLNWTPNHNSFSHVISSNMKQLICTMMHSEPSERPPARRLALFLRKITDKTLRQKDNQIEQLKNQLKMIMAQQR
eukprot:CAMPEP_0197081208 /NCGR_PEP_ID=MMETSP1384-20130603/214518_1 /TAXON_ID=29189 /ORGANISM="Ammonia sp." /LENGTH=629 /DNA_ID=CAMNT_0042520103 /DNA_START=1877 /DNA_END=3766 /DNA_ORIENTATION=-